MAERYPKQGQSINQSINQNQSKIILLHFIGCQVKRSLSKLQRATLSKVT